MPPAQQQQQQQQNEEPDDVGSDIAAAIAASEGTEEEETEDSLGSSEEETEDHGEEEEVDEGEAPEDEASADEDEGEEDEDDDASGERGEEEESDDEGSDDDSDGGDTGRAPVSWDPETREHWKKLPKPVKEQVLKREREVNEALGRSAGARRFADAWGQLLAPYEPIMAAQGVNAYQGVQRLLQLGAGLRMGSQQQKAKIISDIVNQYQVDIGELDSALAGEGGADPRLEQMLEERLRPFNEMMTQQQRQAQQQAERQRSEISTEIQTFAKSKEAEFFDDVRDRMADLLELAHQRGENLSIRDAYDQACKLDPKISNILDKRRRAAEAKKNQGKIRRKKEAASSVRGSPAGGAQDLDVSGAEDDMTQDLMKAVNKHTVRNRRRV